MLRASAKKRGYSCRPKSLNTIEDSIRPLREFDCLLEQKEFPKPETLAKRLREDLEKTRSRISFSVRLGSGPA
jgi:hypothetical protein